MSHRHGEVAREMWQGCGRARRVEQVPIVHVTNGVHLPTWLGAPMRALLDRHLAADWLDARGGAGRLGRRSTRSRPRSCGRRARRAARGLVASVRDRSVAERLGRGDAVRLRAGGGGEL